MEKMILEKKKKIKDLIIKLLDNEKLSEEEEDLILEEIEMLSPDPAISDYIFWEDNLTVDDIVEKAFRYKPIILGDHSKTEK